MFELNLIVIGDRNCGTTRTYLSYLNAAGFKPRALWLVDFIPASDRVRWWRQFPIVGSTWANRLHSLEARPIRNIEPELHEICRLLQTGVECEIDFTGDFDFESHAGSVRRMVAEDYNDPYLIREMLKARDSAFLYTNGGIVPRKLLDRTNIKVIHVHPGIVPDFRGSDCFWWSLLVRGRPGASCFYMAPGIDEGPVLGRAEFILPDLSHLSRYCTPELEPLVYKAIALSFDPHLRAMLLVHVLRQCAKDADLRKLEAESQPQSERPAYLWMHPALRLQALRRLVAIPKEGRCNKLGMVVL